MPKFRFPIIHSAHHVSFAKFLYRNSPKSEALYSFFGLFCLISTISTIYLTQYEFLGALGNVTLYLYQVMSIISLFFSLYMMLPLSIRHPLVVRVLWYVGLIYNMTFCTTFFLLMSQFHHILLMVCALSLFVIFNLCHWKTACIVITIGVSGALLSYKSLIGPLPSNAVIVNGTYSLIYIALFASTALILVFQHNEEYTDSTKAELCPLEDEILILSAQIDQRKLGAKTFNEDMKFLNDKIDFDTECITDRAQEIDRFSATSQKILNYIVHELRLPIGNVMNFTEILFHGLEKIDKELLQELSDEIQHNTKHLSTIILNMLDLATLDIEKIKLNRKTMNLSELVTERAKECHKLYADNKEIDIKLTIKPEILVPVDPSYLRQMIDNLVSNSIRFSDKGLIEISVTRNIDSAILIVQDEGKKISPHELYDLFTPCKTGHSKSEGRSVGLSLCHCVVRAHGGRIDVQSSDSGAIFTVILPMNSWD